MYPQDNIFNIYYNIGRKLPFIVKRIKDEFPESRDPEYFRNKKGRTFLVEKVVPGGKGGKYGRAFGKCYENGVPDNTYMEIYSRTNNPTSPGDYMPEEIPCAGCGEWVLIEIPGTSQEELFPIKRSKDIIEFGKYKGKTFKEIATEDIQYLLWLNKNSRDLRIDLFEIFDIDESKENAKEILSNKITSIIPTTKINDIIKQGKYKGKTWKEVSEFDKAYIKWALMNLRDKNFDIDEFKSILN